MSILISPPSRLKNFPSSFRRPDTAPSAAVRAAASLLVVPRGGDQPSAAATVKKKRRKRRRSSGSSSSSSSTGGGDGSDESSPVKRRRRKVSAVRSASSSAATAEAEDTDTEDTEEEEEEEGTEQLKEAMRQNKDTAAALGNAIRARRDDLLRSDDDDHDNTIHPLHGVDASIASLGLALGTSDPASAGGAAASASASSDGSSTTSSSRNGLDTTADDDEGGGVQPSPSAVLANYFLQSHGGAHGIQSLLSFLSVLAGVGALLLPPPTAAASSSQTATTGRGGWIKLILLRRCLLCALVKHAAGLVAVATLSARRLPDVGFRQTRRRIEALALDPVSQYLFYCALLLVWVPSLVASSGGGGGGGGGWLRGRGKAAAKAAAAAAATATATDAAAASKIVVPTIPWWLNGRSTSFYTTACLLGPVLLREVVSTAWVVSDVFVILASSSSSSSSAEGVEYGEKEEPFLLRAARTSVDAFLSILFTPSRWRDADSASRQKLLAKLVARTSLALEVMTGIIIMYDAIRAFSDYTLSPVGARPALLSVAKRVLCARLYLNFMLVRRKKIDNLVNIIRGGALQVPGRILDVLLEPKAAMGLDGDDDDDDGDYDDGDDSGNQLGATTRRPLGWRDYASMALDV